MTFDLFTFYCFDQKEGLDLKENLIQRRKEICQKPENTLLNFNVNVQHRSSSCMQT